jgi:alpha-L-fucosidase 2
MNQRAFHDGTGNTAYGNKTVQGVQGSAAGSTTVYVSVMAVPKASAADAAAAATAAAAKGRAELLAASTAWWRAYWEQSFVTLPVTRAEGFYYTQMYRFVSSDRVGLHGKKKTRTFFPLLF